MFNSTLFSFKRPKLTFRRLRPFGPAFSLTRRKEFPMADEKSPSLPSQNDTTSSRSSAKATVNEKDAEGISGAR